jgi:hypothetical protein
MLIGGRVTGFASGRLKQWPGSQLKDDLMEWMDHWNGLKLDAVILAAT